MMTDGSEYLERRADLNYIEEYNRLKDENIILKLAVKKLRAQLAGDESCPECGCNRGVSAEGGCEACKEYNKGIKIESDIDRRKEESETDSNI